MLKCAMFMIYMVGFVEYKAPISPNYHCNALGGVTTNAGESYKARHDCHYVDGYGEKVNVTQDMIKAYSSTWNTKEMCVFESRLESSPTDAKRELQLEYIVSSAENDAGFFMNRNWRYYGN